MVQSKRAAPHLVRCGLARKGCARPDYREIGEATGVGLTAVGEYIRRAEVIGITCPVPDEIDDATLEQRMFDTPGAATVVARDDIDWTIRSPGRPVPIG
jgi:hypothetical protein